MARLAEIVGGVVDNIFEVANEGQGAYMTGTFVGLAAFSTLPVDVGWAWNGTTFIAPTVTPAVYRKYTYREFMAYMGAVYPAIFSTMIREKNRDSFLGSQLEVYFEVLKINGGIDFTVEESRVNFAALKSPIPGVSGNVTLLTSAEYDAIIEIEEL